MPSRESSPLQTELHAVTAVKERFDAAYQAAVTSGDTTQAERLKQELTDKMNALKEKLYPFEVRLRVREQYESQKTIMARLKILEPLADGRLGIKGIDGAEFPLPSYQEVSRRMVEKKEVLGTKVDQGFVKLLLVPFGMPLDKLVTIYRAALQKHFDESKLFYTKKDPYNAEEPLEPITELNTEGPLWVWNKYNGADADGSLVYYPQKFSATNHGAKTKTELLAGGQPGFTTRLLEDMPNIPRQGQGKTVGSSGHERAQLDTAGTSIKGYIEQGQTIPNPHEYLKALQTEKQYQHEQGMTPEEQIMYALTHLEETNQVIDDYHGKGSISYQLGAYFPSSEDVPFAYWGRDDRRASLSWFDPGGRVGVCGARSAVGV
ncbi:MAG: hypothetical protein HY983_00540 [Candidatus Magasanikbacteria bacterium]|nr:hypothetical protein [Candidatus Magasanikbacteria bacterium]